MVYHGISLQKVEDGSLKIQVRYNFAFSLTAQVDLKLVLLQVIGQEAEDHVHPGQWFPDHIPALGSNRACI